MPRLEYSSLGQVGPGPLGNDESIGSLGDVALPESILSPNPGVFHSEPEWTRKCRDRSENVSDHAILSRRAS